MRTFVTTLLATGAAALLSANVSAAVIARYNFDSSTNSGKSISDITGNGHDATFTDAVTLSSLNPLDANPNNLSAYRSTTDNTAGGALANAASINLSGGFTFEGWIRPIKTQEQELIEARYSASGSTTRIRLAIDSSLKPVTQAYIGGGTGMGSLHGTTAIPTGDWTHLAWTFDGTTQTLYVNGEEVDSDTPASAPTLPTSLKQLNIGVSLVGEMDDVQIYSNALTKEQVNYDYTHSLSVPEPASLGLLCLAGLALIRRRRNEA